MQSRSLKLVISCTVLLVFGVSSIWTPIVTIPANFHTRISVLSPTFLRDQQQDIVSRINQTPHAPISITGNVNFSSQAHLNGWQGNGTATNPYILANLFINVGTSYSWGISIIATNVSFVLVNTTVIGSNTPDLASIFLDDVSHAVIENNIVINGYYDFQLDNCINSTFLDNLVGDIPPSGTLYGFEITNASDDLFQGNSLGLPNATIYTSYLVYGFDISFSSHNIFQNNVLRYLAEQAFQILGSSYNLFNSNVVLGCGSGFGLGGGITSHGINLTRGNILTNNIVINTDGTDYGLGEELHYTTLINNTAIYNETGTNPANIAVGLMLGYNDSYNLLEGMRIEGDHQGILLDAAYNNTFTNVTVDFAHIGIQLANLTPGSYLGFRGINYRAVNNTFTNLKIMNSYIGIQFTFATDNTFTNVTFSNVLTPVMFDVYSANQNTFVHTTTISATPGFLMLESILVITIAVFLKRRKRKQ